MQQVDIKYYICNTVAWEMYSMVMFCGVSKENKVEPVGFGTDAEHNMLSHTKRKRK